MSSEPQKKYLLKSEDLCVQIAAAGVQYIRSRFDKSGNVQQVTLRGRQGQAHTFLGSDTRPPHESCGGFGLMNEFMPSDQKTYENVSANKGQFLKMGVGVLQKSAHACLPEGAEAAYSQKTDYPIVRPVKIIECADAFCYTAQITQTDFSGFAYQLQKTIRVQKNELTVAYMLQNTGAKPLQFGEYNHNFFCLGTNGKTQDCALRFSFPVCEEKENNVFIAQSDTLVPQPFTQVAAAAVTGWQCLAENAPCSVTVQNKKSGLCVRETISQRPVRCFVWMLPDVLCPELIVEQCIQPEKTVCWQRTYTFL